MAIISFVSGPKRLRMFSGESKGLKEGGESELKSFEGAKPIMAWSMPVVWSFPGRSAVCHLKDINAYSSAPGDHNVLVNIHSKPQASGGLGGQQAKSEILQHDESEYSRTR